MLNSIKLLGNGKLKQQDTTLHTYSIRMAKIQNTDTTKCYQGCGAKELSFTAGKWIRNTLKFMQAFSSQ